MDTKGNRIIAVDFDGTLHTGTTAGRSMQIYTSTTRQ